MAEILYGKPIADKIKEEVKAEMHNFSYAPRLAVIVVGNNQASAIYVKNKQKACEEVGIISDVYQLDNNVTRQTLIDLIKSLNEDDRVNGILVQLPLPASLQEYESEILSTINVKKDVDGFQAYNMGNLVLNKKSLVPCTALGCMRLLEHYNIAVEGKHIVIINRSNIVGKPLANMLINKSATVTVCHSKTENLEKYTKDADILIVAVGKPNFITADMVKEGVVVIDVGINRIDEHKVVGDVDFANVSKIASSITPVPKGVGVLTVASLLHNTIQATKWQNEE